MAFPSKPLTQLLGSNGPVNALTYSSSPGTYILTGSSDRSIRLYNPSRPSAPSGAPSNPLAPPRPTQLIQTYSAHGYAVLDIAVAASNATFASVGGDRSVFLWDVATAKTLRRFGGNQGHTSKINSVCFGGTDDGVLVSGGFDTSVRIWDVKAQSMKPIMVLEEARDSVSCVMVSGKGYELLAGSVDGRLRGYDLRMGKVTTDVIGASVTSLQGTRDGEAVLVGALDGTLRLMDRSGGGLLKSYTDPGFANSEFRMRSTFGGAEKWVVCGNENFEGKGADGEVLVWDTLTGKVVERIRVEGVADANAKKRVGADGQAKERRNVISCVSWKGDGRGDQWCCAGTDGAVTVFGLP